MINVKFFFFFIFFFFFVSWIYFDDEWIKCYFLWSIRRYLYLTGIFIREEYIEKTKKCDIALHAW